MAKAVGLPLERQEEQEDNQQAEGEDGREGNHTDRAELHVAAMDTNPDLLRAEPEGDDYIIILASSPGNKPIGLSLKKPEEQDNKQQKEGEDGRGGNHTDRAELHQMAMAPDPDLLRAEPEEDDYIIILASSPGNKPIGLSLKKPEEQDNKQQKEEEDGRGGNKIKEVCAKKISKTYCVPGG